MSIDVQLNRIDRVYKPGEKVTGAVIVRSPGATVSHNGIKLAVEGAATLQLSARSVGLFEAFYSSLKPIQLMGYNIDVSPAGKLPAGTTEFPFEFLLKPFPERLLFDSYHGVYVNVQYTITVEMDRPMLAGRNFKKTVELNIESVDEEKSTAQPVVPSEFIVSPSSLQNVKQGSKHRIPEFLFTGRLDSTTCNLNKPFTGELTIKRCVVDIKSIELQLVRVETCSYMEGEAREATEIQNIQVADGNVVRDLPIPIYMIFPRQFTCVTTFAKSFKVEFEINLIVLFVDNHMVTENFPIKLYRA